MLNRTKCLFVTLTILEDFANEKIYSKTNGNLLYFLMDLQINWKLKIVDSAVEKQTLTQLHKIQLIYSDLCQLKLLYLDVLFSYSHHSNGSTDHYFGLGNVQHMLYY